MEKMELIDRQAAIDEMAELQGRASTKAEMKCISKAWKRLLKLPSANVDLIKKIEEGIKATGTADEYSVGMCNGMKWCKSLLDGKEPMYYAVQPKLTHDTVQPEITHEQAIDYLHKTGWLQSHDRILTEHEQMYKKAFSVACELLIGANLFGTTEETMFKEIMDKDGIVSSLGYERYILENLLRLTGEDDGTD
jgi:hypothetical protein